jgi:hypothetical protein
MEEIVAPDSHCSVEEEVEAKFLDRFQSILSLLFRLFLFTEGPAQRSVAQPHVGVLGDLRDSKGTNRTRKPPRHQAREGIPKTRMPRSMVASLNLRKPLRVNANSVMMRMFMLRKMVSEEGPLGYSAEVFLACSGMILN